MNEKEREYDFENDGSNVIERLLNCYYQLLLLLLGCHKNKKITYTLRSVDDMPRLIEARESICKWTQSELDCCQAVKGPLRMENNWAHWQDFALYASDQHW